VGGELELVQVVDEDGVGGMEVLVGQVPLGRPRELAVGQLAGLGHPRGPKVHPPGQQRGVKMLPEAMHARGRAGGVRQLPGEARPGVDVGEQVGDLDVRAQPLDVRLQPRDGGVLR
jgi:hypothetical protein